MAALGMEVSTSTGLIDAKGTKRLNRWSGRNDPPARLVNLGCRCRAHAGADLGKCIGILAGCDGHVPMGLAGFACAEPRSLF